MRIPIMLALVGGSLPLVAQDPTEQELLSLLNTPVTVASAKAMTLRESPGVITYLTRDEIRASGARDLIDVLRLVPGFDIAQDVEGATGLAARGLWTYEGKALVLWDGIEVNELLYGNALFGHRFPVDQILRIEIIRGPGSAIYGGLAELAVIKIISLGTDELKGPAVGLMADMGKGKALHSAANVMFGGTFLDGMKVTAGGYFNKGYRSAATFTDADGLAKNMADTSELESRLLHFGLLYKGLTVRGLFDDYELDNPSNTPTSQSRRTFESQNLLVRYEWGLKDGMKLTPFLDYRHTNPWVREVDGQLIGRRVVRLRGGASFNWDIDKAWNLGLGAEHFRDDAGVIKGSPDSVTVAPGGLKEVTYRNLAAYFELGYAGPVNLTVGGRWEDHSKAGSAFVPRFAITKVLGNWHVKALYANAFRTPNVLNFGNASPEAGDIKPEKTTAVEGEVGYTSGGHLVVLNLFKTKVKDPLVWKGGYTNGPETGSTGAEVEYKLRKGWGFMGISYAFHKANNQVEDWAVPGDSSRFLGIASQKVAGLASIKLLPGLTLDPSLTWLGERNGYDWNNAAGTLALKKFDADLLVNLQLAWTQGPWSASLAGFNLLNRKTGFIQAYNGGNVPLPSPGTEFTLKLRYGF